MLVSASYGIGGTLVTLSALGASVFPTVVKPSAGVIGGQIRLNNIGNSGVVQILPQSIAGSTIGGATAVTAITGYAIGASEIFQWAGPACFYLAASGNTCSVSMALFLSEGATLA